MAEQRVVDDMADLPAPGHARKISVIYYLLRSDGAVKIGWSTYLPQRIKQLCRQHGPLQLLVWEPGGRLLEQQRHAEFDTECLDSRYEWFRHSPHLQAHIQQIHSELAEAMEIYGSALHAAIGA